MNNNKDIIKETLDYFEKYHVQDTSDLFNIFTEKMNDYNNKRIDNILKLFDNALSIVRFCIVFGVISILFQFYITVFGCIYLLICSFLCTATLIYVAFKCKKYDKLLISNGKVYAEFLMNAFIDNYPNYYDKNTNSKNWVGFISLCNEYINELLAQED